jgi:hypothetical protein
MATLLAYIRAHATDNAPLVPVQWDRLIEDDGWATIYPLGSEARPDVFFHARLVLRHPSDPNRALFVCTSDRAAMLQHLADRIAEDDLAWTRTWARLPLLRADATALAVALRAAWPDERPRDEGGNPVGARVAHYARMTGFDINAED